ncbi:hypothetical protein DSO57_1019899 [Entomophthora muscae]|uniref:Uncharacterized protein n=1 Tax=Entomophthora muscae TaxID=34485 RepID=A0ACC2TF04_9FUNG|nr:hypothetical protein DSO57_1019899 [Entomophthora muscae]
MLPSYYSSKEPWLVLGYTSVYYREIQVSRPLVTYVMIGILLETTLFKLNVGALLHYIGEKLTNEWIPGNCTASGTQGNPGSPNLVESPKLGTLKRKFSQVYFHPKAPPR